MLLRNLCLAGMIVATSAGAGETMLFDFTQATHGWWGNPRITSLKSTPEGLAFTCDGQEDPWIEGPPMAIDLSAAPIRLTLRLRTNGDQGGELFYGPSFVGDKRVGVRLINDGKWHDYTVVIPPQPKGGRLRFDPGGHGGDDIVLQSIKAQILASMTPPPTTSPEQLACEGPELVSGDLLLCHAANRWGLFQITVAGKPFARSYGRDEIGVLGAKEAVFMPLAKTPCTVAKQDAALVASVAFTDHENVHWRLERRFVPGPAGMIDVTTTVRVTRDRQVFHLPMLTLFPGFGTFGEQKTQAILPGVEYLADEPSSSESDVRGAQAMRRIVDDLKLCFPLMALAQDGRYLGVCWNRADHPAPLFDSPDRVFSSGSHLFGLWYPGVGPQRLENSIAALDAMLVRANQPLTFRYTILAGEGQTIIPAVQAYVKTAKLAPLPEFTGGFDAAVNLLSHGWLDSDSNQGGLWHHAVWGDRFPPQPAADAVCFQRWLASETPDEALAKRLRASAEQGLNKTQNNLSSGVSHVHYGMLPYLLYGGVEQELDQVAAGARQALGRFRDDGILLYKQREGRPDYSSTHFAEHANGLAAPALIPILQACLLVNDPKLRSDALALVDKETTLYANTVPRGAQTWECPLHTPDILASGRMVDVYVMAYQVSGHSKYLEQARYWAWTGVPFIYLDSPVDKPVGAYATIAVFGATNWQAPLWIGRPVQWCGLVYGASLNDLAELDPVDGKLWRRLATGITRCGLQQSWSTSDAERQGLLPDFYHLREQRSDGPAINPGTVGSHLPSAYGKSRIFDRKVLGTKRVLVHAPGSLRIEADNRIAVDAWPSTPYHILLTNLNGKPSVSWNDLPVTRVEYLPRYGVATVTVEGKGVLTVCSQ